MPVSVGDVAAAVVGVHDAGVMCSFSSSDVGSALALDDASVVAVAAMLLVLVVVVSDGCVVVSGGGALSVT